MIQLSRTALLTTLNRVFAVRPTQWGELRRNLPVTDEQKTVLTNLMTVQPGTEELFNGEEIKLWGIIQLLCEVGFNQRLGTKVNKETGEVHSFVWVDSHHVAPASPIKAETMEEGSMDLDYGDDPWDDDEDEEEDE